MITLFITECYLPLAFLNLDRCLIITKNPFRELYAVVLKIYPDSSFTSLIVTRVWTAKSFPNTIPSHQINVFDIVFIYQTSNGAVE